MFPKNFTCEYSNYRTALLLSLKSGTIYNKNDYRSLAAEVAGNTKPATSLMFLK